MKRARPIGPSDGGPAGRPAGLLSAAGWRRWALAAPAVLLAFAVGAAVRMATVERRGAEPAAAAADAPVPRADEPEAEDLALEGAAAALPLGTGQEPPEPNAELGSGPGPSGEDVAGPAPDAPPDAAPEPGRAASHDADVPRPTADRPTPPAPKAAAGPKEVARAEKAAAPRPSERAKPARTKPDPDASVGYYRPPAVPTRPRRVSRPAARIIGPIVIGGGCADALGRRPSARAAGATRGSF